MGSLLFLISFLLHIVLLIAVYFLYQQLQQMKIKQNNELEEVFLNFLKEMRMENERLQEQIKREQLFNRQNELNQNVENRVREQRDWEKIEKAPLPSVLNKQDQVETSLESNVFQLANQGLTAAEIAKKLDRGKTEIELMLKLYQKRQ